MITSITFFIVKQTYAKGKNVKDTIFSHILFIVGVWNLHELDLFSILDFYEYITGF